MAKHGRLTCPSCGANLVPTLSGPRCPRLGSCGRGGIEETGDAIRTLPRSGADAAGGA